MSSLVCLSFCIPEVSFLGAEGGGRDSKEQVFRLQRGKQGFTIIILSTVTLGSCASAFDVESSFQIRKYAESFLTFL